jgi:hypothetical protein
MIIILGLVVLIAAVVIGVVGVLATTAAAMRWWTRSRCSATT